MWEEAWINAIALAQPNVGFGSKAGVCRMSDLILFVRRRLFTAVKLEDIRRNGST